MSAERTALREQAYDVLGRAKLTIDSINPAAFGYLGTTMQDELERCRSEADAIRPALSILAVRWPDARDYVTEISTFLGGAPVGLGRLQYLREEDVSSSASKQYEQEMQGDKESAVAALNRAIDLIRGVE